MEDLEDADKLLPATPSSASPETSQPDVTRSAMSMADQLTHDSAAQKKPEIIPIKDLPAAAGQIGLQCRATLPRSGLRASTGGVRHNEELSVGSIYKRLSTAELEALQVEAKRLEVQRMLQRNAKHVTRRSIGGTSTRKKLSTSEIEALEIEAKRLEVQDMLNRNRRRMMARRSIDRANASMTSAGKSVSADSAEHDEQADLVNAAASTELPLEPGIPKFIVQQLAGPRVQQASLPPSNCRRYRLF